MKNQCGTCRHWQRIEKDIGSGQFEVYILLRLDRAGGEAGRCAAKPMEFEIPRAGQIECRQPVTDAGFHCDLWAAKDDQ